MLSKTYIFVKMYWKNIIKSFVYVGKDLDFHFFIDWFLIFKLLSNFDKGNYDQLKKSYSSLINRNKLIGYYYKAKQEFMYGNYEESLRSINIFLESNIFIVDSYYLKSEICFNLNDKEQAWQLLEYISSISKRLKTWLLMANLVNNIEDYNRLLKNYNKSLAINMVSSFDLNIIEYLTLGALRCKAYDDAIAIWRDTFRKIQDDPTLISAKKINKKKFTVKHAERALKDLKMIFDQLEIEMFLVSGTLLGCIREGQLLGHDKDIDVGVWDNINYQDLIKVLRNSGKFYVQASRSVDVVRVKHINNIPIDIFIHKFEDGKYWHGGVKLKWYNSIFNLTPVIFLGDKYLIPKDYDIYLKENYGDWRSPKTDFDSTYDTPNATVVNKYEVIAYTYKKLLFNWNSENHKKYIDILKKYNELNDYSDMS